MRTLVGVFFSTIILIVLYALVDVDKLLLVLASVDPAKLFLSMLLLMALALVSSLRLKLLAYGARVPIGLSAAIAATFAANALNLILPAKGGDLVKAPMLRQPGQSSTIPALNLSIYEKAADIFALFVWGTVAITILDDNKPVSFGFAGATVGLCALLIARWPARLLLRLKRAWAPTALLFLDRLLSGWIEMLSQLLSKPKTIIAVLLASLLIWMGHFLQIGIIAWALGVEERWVTLAAMLPVVILVGLVPLTVAGIGPRVAAIVVLMGPIIGPDKAAALGVLFWLRYLVPGLFGLPFIPRFSAAFNAAGVGR